MFLHNTQAWYFILPIKNVLTSLIVHIGVWEGKDYTRLGHPMAFRTEEDRFKKISTKSDLRFRRYTLGLTP